MIARTRTVFPPLPDEESRCVPLVVARLATVFFLLRRLFSESILYRVDYPLAATNAAKPLF